MTIYKHNEPDSRDLLAPAQGCGFGCLLGTALIACTGLTLSFFLAPEFWKRMLLLALAIGSAALLSSCAAGPASVNVFVDTSSDSAIFYPDHNVGRVVMVVAGVGEYYANDTVGAAGCYRLVESESGEIGEAYYLNSGGCK